MGLGSILESHGWIEFWPVHDYLILYKPGFIPLEIITIAGGSQDIPRIISGRGL